MVVVCESREVSKDAIICQSTNYFRCPRLTLVRSAHRRTEGSSIDYIVLQQFSNLGTVHYNSYCTPY